MLIIIGWWLQRANLFPPQSAGVLSAFVYWAAAPTLLFTVIAKQDIGVVLGSPLIAAAASGLVSALLFVALAATAMRQRGGDLVLGAMSASVNNIAYMGIPVALYVLNSADHVVPVLVFQMGFLTPAFFVMAEMVGQSEADPGHTLRRIVKTTVSNPMVIGSFLGIVVAVTGIELPSFVMETTNFIGQAAPPTILIAFGASLVGQSIRMPRRTRAVVIWATACKQIIQPGVAGLVGWALGATGMTLAGIIIMAALPTAQNAFIASTRARTGMEVTQGTILLTTLLTPLLVIGLVFGLEQLGIYSGV